MKKSSFDYLKKEIKLRLFDLITGNSFYSVDVVKDTEDSVEYSITYNGMIDCIRLKFSLLENFFAEDVRNNKYVFSSDDVETVKRYLELL